MSTTETSLPKWAEAAEAWLPIGGHGGRYEVSDHGRVRAMFRARGHPVPPRILKPSINRDGYLFVRLALGRRHASSSRLVHVLLLEAFVGPRPDGQEGRHLNGNPADCCLGNLAWGTKQENCADSIAHGTHWRGEEHANAKLTEGQVREIRRLLSEGWRQRSIAAQFGVSFQLISLIKQDKVWRHVEMEAS